MSLLSDQQRESWVRRIVLSDPRIASGSAGQVARSEPGPQGPPGPAPPGTGYVHVTDGVLDAPAVTATPAAHSHAPSEVTGTAVVTSDSRLSNARTPIAHTHAASEVTGTAVLANDARLSDARTPIAHAVGPGGGTTVGQHTYPGGTSTFLRSDGTFASPAGSANGYVINVQALTSSPTDAQTVYFGMLPKAPTTTANSSKVYMRKAGTIKIAEIYCYSGTAGTNEAWSLYIRKNNASDTLIATVSAATSERVFSNASLNISVAAGDYIEIKGVQPTWATNPATTIYAGYIYVETT